MISMAWKTGGVRRITLAMAAPVCATDGQTVESKKFGYTMKIPAQFQRQGEETETSTWIYQPGSAPAAAAPAAESKDEGKGKKLAAGAAASFFSAE